MKSILLFLLFKFCLAQKEIIPDLIPYMPTKKLKPQLTPFRTKDGFNTFHEKIKNLELFYQTKEKSDEILLLYVRFPSTNLHDHILRELHQNYKKQDRYTKGNSSALFEFKNRSNLDITYQANCAITCYPVFVEWKMSNLNAPSIFNELFLSK